MLYMKIFVYVEFDLIEIKRFKAYVTVDFFHRMISNQSMYLSTGACNEVFYTFILNSASDDVITLIL
jgi:hypothetical protein